MTCSTYCHIVCIFTASLFAGEYVRGSAPDDDLRQLGCLDVTKAPYFADNTGKVDATKAIQQAVNDARDNWLVCFFPEGTYLISDTISCEQQVTKLNRPRRTDAKTQNYWDRPNRIIMLGSTKGNRPVLKLAPDAKGFEDPTQPKMAVWIWAQTRNNAPGKEEPEWGKEQPNISFGHIFRGIDIDVRGHAGAIGIRHSGSQGSTLQDSVIQAEGAYAGMSNCPGQGGGTYNIQVLGGRFGITIGRNSRFPLLVACTFRGQTEAAVTFTQPSQMPTLLVGCLLEPAGRVAVDLLPNCPHAGISLVDCIVRMSAKGVVCRTKQAANIFLEDVIVRGAAAVRTGGPQIPTPASWTKIQRYSCLRAPGVNLLNGHETSAEIVNWMSTVAEPAVETMRKRHYSSAPSFEDEGVVSVKLFGAKGDQITDDTEAFRKAIAASDKVFVPKGKYKLSGTLQLGPKTQLFGLANAFCSIGDVAAGRRIWQRIAGSNALTITTKEGANAAPSVSFLSVRGRIDWRAGGGTCMLAPSVLTVSASGGGKFYGVMARGKSLVLEGIRQPTSFYALNVERKGTNPQSLIRNCANIRVYFFKVEAGTVNRPNAGDANTPCRIADSENIRVYCMYGVVRRLQARPMLDVVNSRDVLVAQLKTFSPGKFPHLVETNRREKYTVPSSKPCALFVRNCVSHRSMAPSVSLDEFPLSVNGELSRPQFGRACRSSAGTMPK